MHVIRGLHNLTASHRGCVATIGNFDGVHRGHQAILQQCREHAARLNVPLTVVVFEPQPREFFAGDQAPPRLTRLREKVRLLRDHGIGYAIPVSLFRCSIHNACTTKKNQSGPRYAGNLVHP